MIQRDFPKKIVPFAIVIVHGVGWCHISWPWALPSFWHVQSVQNPSIPCPLWKVHERSAVFVEWGPRSENLRISILKGSYKCLEMMVKGLVVGSLNTNWRAKETEWSEELPVFWWENCLQVIVRMWFNWRSWWNGGDLDDAVLGSWKRYPDLKLLETATCWTMSACTFVARIQICYSEDAGFFFFFSEQLPLRQEKQTLYIIVSTNGENYNWWKKSCTWNLQDPS